MDSRAPKQAPSKDERKKNKLKLNKETLKDLSAAEKEIKGGLAGATHISCGENCA